MPASATLVGAAMGLGVQFYSNAVRKLPLMRHPWEHLLGMGIGAYAANQLVAFEVKAAADLEKQIEAARSAQKRRFIGTMRPE
ncbi:unnamed protein product [Closterium sp. Naga37s-1]|nr:unnamed protein product [Closterium sp. Naga37s-1]